MIAAGQPAPTADSWTYDVTRGVDHLPEHEGRRIGLWLLAHGLDPYRVHRPRVIAGHGWAALAVDIAVDLPDGTVAYNRRDVDLRQPPPVPWTA